MKLKMFATTLMLGRLQIGQISRMFFKGRRTFYVTCQHYTLLSLSQTIDIRLTARAYFQRYIIMIYVLSSVKICSYRPTRDSNHLHYIRGRTSTVGHRPPPSTSSCLCWKRSASTASPLNKLSPALLVDVLRFAC